MRVCVCVCVHSCKTYHFATSNDFLFILVTELFVFWHSISLGKLSVITSLNYTYILIAK
jgi:hypothetical protein